MDVEMKGDAKLLSQEISRKNFPEYVIQVIRSTWNTLEIQVSLR